MFVKKFILIMLITLCFNTWVIAAQPIQENYFISKVIDGDSLVVEHNGHTFEARLSQIDAPEYQQDFGIEAYKKLSELCLHKSAQIRIDDVDNYQRKIIWLYCNGIEVNTTLVAQGFAWRYNRFAKDKRLLALELAARQTKQGLWKNAAAIPPWQWRRLNMHSQFGKHPSNLKTSITQPLSLIFIEVLQRSS